ncbi:hypothetical protein D3C76_1488210 [compost metagenome]
MAVARHRAITVGGGVVVLEIVAQCESGDRSSDPLSAAWPPDDACSPDARDRRGGAGGVDSSSIDAGVWRDFVEGGEPVVYRPVAQAYIDPNGGAA